MSKRILLIIGTLNSGGAERVASFLANSLCDLGCTVSIAVIVDAKTKFYKINDEIKIHDLSFCKRNFLRVVKELKKLDKEEHYDTIISFFFKFGAIARLAFSKKKNLICREGGDPLNPERNRIVQFITSLLVKRSNTIVFQTKWQKNYYSKAIQRKSVIIPNPITIKNNFKRDLIDDSIVTVGRLCDVKNQSELIQAFAIVHKDFPKANLIIYGDGPLKDNLLKEINLLHLTKCAKICNATIDIHDRIRNARLFVLCSKHEGMPNSLLEAQLIGIPCITSNFNGADEVVQDRKNGLIYNNQKCGADKLASAIKELLNDNVLYNNVSRCGIECYSKYDPSAVIEQWVKII